MSMDTAPEMPIAQRIYGEIVYWVTIAAAIICMIGPLIAMADVDRNVLNPHYLFSGIFDGEEPASIWALSSNEEVRLTVFTEDAESGRAEHPSLLPREALEILKQMKAPAEGSESRPTIGIEGEPLLARLPEGSEEDHYSLEVVDARDWDDAREIVLARYSEEVFSSGHFWYENLGAGDGFTQFGLALGCSVALWALIAVAGAYLKDRLYLFVFLSLWVATLVVLSAGGFIKGEH